MTDINEEQKPPQQENYIAQLKKNAIRLNKEDLRKRILRFLDENCILTLATCADNQPRSTPLRYRHKDFTVYSFTEGGGKIKNIKKNPKVSFSIYGDYSGFDSVSCLQAWGEADIIRPEEERYRQIREILDLEKREDLKRLGVETAPRMRIIRVKIQRARFLSFPEKLLYHVLDLP